MQLFKRRAILTPRQVKKAKWSLGLAVLYVCAQLVLAEILPYEYQDTKYAKQEITKYPRGQIVEYTNDEEFCKR